MALQPNISCAHLMLGHSIRDGARVPFFEQAINIPLLTECRGGYEASSFPRPEHRPVTRRVQ
jgi:hypothetical protein